MFLPVGTNRPARQRPAALDLLILSGPFLGPTQMVSLSRATQFYFVSQCTSCACPFRVLYPVGQRRLPSLFACGAMHISPRACLALRAPSSPRAPHGTTLPAAAGNEHNSTKLLLQVLNHASNSKNNQNNSKMFRLVVTCSTICTEFSSGARFSLQLSAALFYIELQFVR